MTIEGFLTGLGIFVGVYAILIFLVAILSDNV